MAVRPDPVNVEDACSQMPRDIKGFGDFSTMIWYIKEVSQMGATGDPTKEQSKREKRCLRYNTICSKFN